MNGDESNHEDPYPSIDGVNSSSSNNEGEEENIDSHSSVQAARMRATQNMSPQMGNSQMNMLTLS